MKGIRAQMEPKCKFGPKKVPILLKSPKFLTLPSGGDAALYHLGISPTYFVSFSQPFGFSNYLNGEAQNNKKS